jgi:MoxR-like ATPase
MRFKGSDTYVATDDLKLAVNAAITLQRPLLVKGEPGTGKTKLAEEVAQALGLPLLEWHIKSTTKAQQGLYEYDAVTRACTRSRTTSLRACSGRRSRPTRRSSC